MARTVNALETLVAAEVLRQLQPVFRAIDEMSAMVAELDAQNRSRRLEDEETLRNLLARVRELRRVVADQFDNDLPPDPVPRRLS